MTTAIDNEKGLTGPLLPSTEFVFLCGLIRNEREKPQVRNDLAILHVVDEIHNQHQLVFVISI